MNPKVVLIFLLVISSCGSVSAQKKLYVYPPLCDSVILETDFEWDSSFIRIDCEILSDSINTFYIMANLVNNTSVPGWIIIYSYWNQGEEEKLIKLNGIERGICLNKFDFGYETFTDPTETTEVNGVYVRRRSIAIINSFTCQVYYLESKDLFKLYVSDADLED